MSRRRIGIFGTGLMATIYADILRQRGDAEIAAVAGNTVEKTEAFANRFGAKAYPGSQYERMLAETQGLNALIVATPEWVRSSALAIAVTSKKPILLEKPFADSWEEAVKCHALLRGYPAGFQVCHVLRYSPRFFAMREAVRRGDIGDVRNIFSRRNSNHTRVARVLGKTDLAYWLTPHDVDIMRWVTQAEVEQVYAVSRGELKSSDDYLIANLKFTSGVDAVLEISWCQPPISGAAREAAFEVRGTKGTIELEDFDMNVKIFTADGKVQAPDTYEDYVVQGQRGGFFKNLIDGWVAGLGDAGGNPAALEDALETTRVCAMIRRSIDEKRIVSRTELC